MFARVRGLLLRVLLLLLVCASLARAQGLPDTVDLRRRFGEQTCPTCIGDTWTFVYPGERFMFAVHSAFDCGSCDGHTTLLEIEFPESVVPRTEIYGTNFVTVVGNTVRAVVTDRAGIFVNIPFDVKEEGDLPPGANEIALHTTITVTPPSDPPLVAEYDDAIELVRPSSFTASAAATPAEVQLSEGDDITVKVTFQNTGSDDLTNMAPTADPTPSVAAAVEKKSGPTPASLSLGDGESGTITYTYTPKKAGKVAFTFAGFAAQGPSGSVHAPGVTTGTVAIKEDVAVDVSVSPSSLQTDSSAASTGTVTLKVTNKNGEPISRQSVALNFPQYFGILDLNPRLLVCDAGGALVFPPGADATLNDAAYATTSGSGEASFELVLGTQRRAPQLLVVGAAIDADKLDVADDGVQVDLPASGAGVNPVAHGDLDALQRADLPESARAATDATIVARGAPADVLRGLVRWLESKREAGGNLVRDVDWVPIASADDAHVGVLLYARADLQAVLAHLEGTGAAPAAYVLQIENTSLGLFGYEVKWERPWMALSTWENSALDGEGLVVPGGSQEPRGRAKSAVGLVTTSPYAFLGYPYPAGGPSADSGYGAADCIPKLDGMTMSVHSPVTLLVKDAQGRGVGLGADGVWTNDLPGAVYTSGEPTRILLPPGSYQADIVGTGKGPATIVLSAPGAAPKSFTFTAKPKKTGTLTFDASIGSAAGTFNKKPLNVVDGVPITVAGVPKKVKVHAGDPLTLTVTNVYGRPVAGARVHAVGKELDAEGLTGADGVAAIPLAVTKKTKKLVVTVDGAGVVPTSLKVRVKLLKG